MYAFTKSLWTNDTNYASNYWNGENHLIHIQYVI